MKRARVAPMVMSLVEESQLTTNESDDTDEVEGRKKTGIPTTVWHDVVEKTNKKKEIQEQWQRMTNTIRHRVKYTKAFEEANQHLMKDKHNVRMGTNLTVQCLLEQETVADALRRKATKLVRGSSTRNQERGKWLLKYFIALSEITDPDQKKVDFEQLKIMIQKGVDVNCVDKHGQCVLHEVARIWHPDVAMFFLKHGSVINHPDNYGRTPLHVACATDYAEMVEFLLENGADITCRTYEENQTAIHYAAKNDAAESLKVLLQYGADVTDMDYKQRTPLQLAAELDRSTTAELLIEEGAHAGVYDDSNMAALVVMIRKMPKVALQALDQFYTTNRANRRQFFYLNFLVPPNEAETCWAKSPLEVAVEYKQYQLLLHPVFQRLIEVKWQRLGKWGAWFNGILNFVLTILWTARLCVLPTNPKEIYKGSDDEAKVGMIVIDILATLMLFVLLISETKEYYKAKRRTSKYKKWREEQLQRDLKYSHPRWPEERAYLEREIRAVEEYQSSYLKDQWNFIDWLTQFLMIATMVLHLVNYRVRTNETRDSMRITASVTMIFLWLRLLKYARPFKTLGLFVVMLSHVVVDTMKILFLAMHVFIPYIAAFWILFGAYDIEGYTMKNGELFYNIFLMCVVGDFGFDKLSSHSEIMSRVLVGTYIFLGGIVCLNLFIALLSDTFQRVYDNAKATAEMQRASIINEIEADLSAHRLRKFNNWITQNCAPESLYYDDDVIEEENGELKKLTQQIRARVDEVHQLLETSNSHHNNNNNRRVSTRYYSSGSNKNKATNELNSSCRSLRSELQQEQQQQQQQQEQTNTPYNVETNDLKMVVDTLNELKSEYYKSMIQTRAEIAGLGLMLKDLLDDSNAKTRSKRKQQITLPGFDRGQTSTDTSIKTTSFDKTSNYDEQEIAEIIHPQKNTTSGGMENMNLSNQRREHENQNYFEGHPYHEQRNAKKSNDQLIKNTWGCILTKGSHNNEGRDENSKNEVYDSSERENEKTAEDYDENLSKFSQSEPATSVMKTAISRRSEQSTFMKETTFSEENELEEKVQHPNPIEQQQKQLWQEKSETFQQPILYNKEKELLLQQRFIEKQQRLQGESQRVHQQEYLLHQRFQEQKLLWKQQQRQQLQQQQPEIVQQRQQQQQQQQFLMESNQQGILPQQKFEERQQDNLGQKKQQQREEEMEETEREI